MNINQKNVFKENDHKFPKNFYLKRLHSIFGVIPLCSFVLYHIIKNGIFMQGNALLIEGIFVYEQLWFVENILPALMLACVLFHSIYGFFLITHTKYKKHLKNYIHSRNIKFYWQRISCIFIILFLIHHLILVYNYQESEVAFVMATELKNPAIFFLYIIGTISAIFHATNGLSTSAITWGICVTPRSQKVCALIMDTLCVIFSLIGTVTLFMLRNF